MRANCILQTEQICCTPPDCADQASAAVLTEAVLPELQAILLAPAGLVEPVPIRSRPEMHKLAKLGGHSTTQRN